MPKLIDADALCSRLDYMMSESSDVVSLSAIVALAVVKGTLIPDIPDASEPLQARIKELEEALSTVRAWISGREPAPSLSQIDESIGELMAKSTKGYQEA